MIVICPKRRQYWCLIPIMFQIHQFLSSQMVSIGCWNFLNISIQGGVTENFDFKINDDTEVYWSCSSVLNGEVFVFGGYNTSNNRRKQVKLNIWLVQCYLSFRFPKSLDVSWNELGTLVMNSAWELVVHSCILRNEFYCALLIQIRAHAKGWSFWN